VCGRTREARERERERERERRSLRRRGACAGFLAWREKYPWSTGGLTRNAVWYTAFACLNGGWVNSLTTPLTLTRTSSIKDASAAATRHALTLTATWS
jgi:hypothetical protein